ncbi:MAG: thiamine pyrophosphate-binding protein [Acidimicrobiia bacterium]|nr:thiamine pyrophosphate-binding protein [Acidimicrobiia bacterium]
MADTLLGGGSGGFSRVTEHHAGVTVAEVLRAGGVDTLFFLPGGHVAPIANGCRDAGIRVVGTRHECAAVHMAEAWARCTGRTGVAAVTAGPGFTNALTGLADSQATGVPVVLLGGRTQLGLRGRGAVQDVDQSSLAAVVAKWTGTVVSPDAVAATVRTALGAAGSGRPGAAYVDLPTDVLVAETPPFTGAVPDRTASAATPDAVEAAVRMLAGAERPVCVTGGGAFWAGAGDALRRFVQASGIPVTTASHSRGLVGDSEEGCLGSLVHGGVAVMAADVVLVVGSRFNGNLCFGGPPLWREEQRIVMIDCDPAAFALNRVPDVAVEGDAAVVLDQMALAWTGTPHKEWRDSAAALAEMSRAHWLTETEGDARGVHPGVLAREACAFAAAAGPGGATIVLDGGDILGWGLAFAGAERPGSVLFTSDALGALGVGVPYAIGAALAAEAPVVALIGDGAFGFSAMEIETAVRAGAAPILVVSNNGSWGDVRYEESEWFGRTVETDLTPVRYDRMCEALGGHGERVETPEELVPALERALASGVVSVVDVVTDPDRPNEILRNMGALNLQ